jgi:hypothetical protein
MNENDKQIKILLADIAKKEHDLSFYQRYENKTSMVFPFEGKEYNLNALNDVELLTRMYAYIGLQSDYISRVFYIPKLENMISNTINGYSYSDWQDDIFNRLQKLYFQKKIKSLKEAKTKIEGMLSTDAKTADALSSVRDLLSKL